MPGEPHLCTVAAVNAYVDWLMAARAARGLVGEPGANTPFMQNVDGTQLAASEIVRALRAAAVALGREPVMYTTYSLRIGGATQLKRCGYDEVFIMLAGGWKTVSSMRGYCRHVAADSAGVSTDMAAADPLAVAAARGQRAAAAVAAAAPAATAAGAAAAAAASAPPVSGRKRRAAPSAAPASGGKRARAARAQAA